jgi:hypothetical protein
LFRLQDGRLVERRQSYVPAGRLGDLLNTNPVFNFLAERSDAFCLIKERLTRLVKERMVRQNLAEQSDAGQGPAASTADGGAAAPDRRAHQRRLLAAIYERIYQGLHARGIPLIIQSIPVQRPAPLSLTDLFPRAEFPIDRPGLYYL